MNLHTETLSVLDCDFLFPSDEDGKSSGEPDQKAVAIARKHLGEGDIVWHIPGCFDVRYGSSYVATARRGEKAVRFLSDDGTFNEGDDEGAEA